MSVKVVRGLIGQDHLTLDNAPKVSDSIRASASASTSSAVISHRVAAGEAVVNSVRSYKALNANERIREEREAKNVAKEIAGQIVGDQFTAETVHGNMNGAISVQLE